MASISRFSNVSEKELNTHNFYSETVPEKTKIATKYEKNKFEV